MTEKLITASVTVLIGIVGVAVLALLVSKNSDTAGVIGAGAGGFGCVLKTALTGRNACGSVESVTSNITFGNIPPIGTHVF